ncbi:MAG: hypothetical protein WCI36_05515 [bacterium]
MPNVVEKYSGSYHPFAIANYKKGVVFIYSIKSAKKNSVFLSYSENGIDFFAKQELNIFSENGKKQQLENHSKVSFFVHGKDCFLVFSETIARKKQVMIAKSTDMINFKVMADDVDLPVDTFSFVCEHKHKKSFLAYYGNKSIFVAGSTDLKTWHSSGKLFGARKKHFDDGDLDVVGTVVVDRGILVLYEVKKPTKTKKKELKIGVALFALDKPYAPIWRCDAPIWQEKMEKKDFPERFLGSAIIDDSLHIFWASPFDEIISKVINLSSSGLIDIKDARKLKKHHANPILKPQGKNSWENDATFNPAAIFLDNKIHLLYRAIGQDGISTIGYASSTDGVTIGERLESPIFSLAKYPKITIGGSDYVSGGSWAGCEDPRITKIGKRIYMTYVLFDGANPPGVGLTSISVSDFLNKVWKWKKPKLISKHGEIQKNWMLFPEKIKGKYAILHSITPKISIEYVDSLEKGGIEIESGKKPGIDEHRWDNIVRGAGSPPLWTKHGWLVLYHAMDKRDPNKYKVGAMLLDHDDPTKILHRCKHPILEPVESYENEGAKSGVVYVCGAVIKDDKLLVYYGGADSVVCVASEDLDAFLKDMMTSAVSSESILNRISNQ